MIPGARPAVEQRSRERFGFDAHAHYTIHGPDGAPWQVPGLVDDVSADGLSFVGAHPVAPGAGVDVRFGLAPYPPPRLQVAPCARIGERLYRIGGRLLRDE